MTDWAKKVPPLLSGTFLGRRGGLQLCLLGLGDFRAEGAACVQSLVQARSCWHAHMPTDNSRSFLGPYNTWLVENDPITNGLSHCHKRNACCVLVNEHVRISLP
eukprot:5948921-Amphidinium_carterae.1